MLEEALDGLVICFQDVNSDITKITTTDIIYASKLSSDTAQYYYADPFKIISDVHSSISGIIKGVVKDCDKQKLTAEKGIRLLLEMLKNQPKMLDILSLSSDYLVWKLNLTPFAKLYVSSWEKYDESHWNFMYFSFCFLFMMIIKKWRFYKYDEKCLPTCISLIKKLLVADAIFTDEIREWVH